MRFIGADPEYTKKMAAEYRLEKDREQFQDWYLARQARKVERRKQTVAWWGHNEKETEAYQKEMATKYGDKEYEYCKTKEAPSLSAGAPVSFRFPHTPLPTRPYEGMVVHSVDYIEKEKLPEGWSLESKTVTGSKYNHVYTYTKPKTKETKMKKLVRNIMMLCTGLCFARLMMFLHPLVANLQDVKDGSTSVGMMWIFIIVVTVFSVGMLCCIRAMLSAAYGWIFK